MRKSDAVEYFGSPTKLAKAAGVSLPAVSRWGEVIPERRAASGSSYGRRVEV